MTCGDKCFKLTAERSEEVNEMKTAQEEADTRMLLHAKQAAADYDSIIVVTGDIDVLILCMVVQARIDCNLYVKCGTRARTSILRLLYVKKMCSRTRNM